MLDALRRRPLLAAMFAFGAAPALGDDDWFSTASGARAPIPAIESLDCRQMAAVLREIDRTGYRLGAAAPDSEDDLALLRYENRLAQRYYAECVGAPTRSAAPEGVFSSGYEDADDALGR